MKIEQNPSSKEWRNNPGSGEFSKHVPFINLITGHIPIVLNPKKLQPPR
jgi:hypothetical protein